MEREMGAAGCQLFVFKLLRVLNLVFFGVEGLSVEESNCKLFPEPLRSEL